MGIAAGTYADAPMWLVYRDADGALHYQPWEDLMEVGTLVDPQTDEDMEMVGWTLRHPARESAPAPGAAG